MQWRLASSSCRAVDFQLIGPRADSLVGHAEGHRGRPSAAITSFTALSVSMSRPSTMLSCNSNCIPSLVGFKDQRGYDAPKYVLRTSNDHHPTETAVARRLQTTASWTSKRWIHSTHIHASIDNRNTKLNVFEHKRSHMEGYKRVTVPGDTA